MILRLIATYFICLISCSSSIYDHEEINKQEKNIQLVGNVTTEYDYDYRIINESQALFPFYTILSPQFAFNTLMYFKDFYPSYNFGVDRNTNSSTIRVNFSNVDNTRVAGQSGILNTLDFFDSQKIYITTDSFTDYFVGLSFQQRANENKNLVSSTSLTYNVQKYYLNFLSSSGTSLRLVFYIFHGPVEYHSSVLSLDFPGYFVQSEIVFQGGIYQYSYYLDYMFIFDDYNASTFYEILNYNVNLNSNPYYETGYQEGYDYGREQGYSLGHYEGSIEGYDEGFDEGTEHGKEIAEDPGSDIYRNTYNIGYRDGYDDGVDVDSTTATIFAGILDIGLLPINVFLQILNFNFLGINISALVTSFLTVSIALIIIRMIITGSNGGGKE